MFHCVTIDVTNRGCHHGLVECQIGPSRGARNSALEAPSEAPKIGQIRPQFSPSRATQWDLMEAVCLRRGKFFFGVNFKSYLFPKNSRSNFYIETRS